MSHAERQRKPAAGVFDAAHAALTLGLLLVVSAVAFESLAVATILPVAVRNLGGLDLYGWAFSAFLLTSLVSTIAASRSADQRGPALPFACGIVLFGCGLILAGLAPAMLVFIAGRALQGLGAGAIGAMAYVVIGRAYPDALRARMLALQSSAWVVPALVGPGVAGVVAEHFTWRVVLLGLLPLLLLAGALLLPALRRMAVAAPSEAGGGKVLLALRLTVGAGLLLAGLDMRTPLLALVLVVAGVVLAWPALRRLLPAGTLTAQPGLPAGLAVHALLNFGYFSAEAFLPLGLVVLRGLSAAEAGLVLTVAALTWTAGAWLQARFDARMGGRGRRGRVVCGFVLILLGASLTAVAVLTTALPALVAGVGWGISGIGMGIAYPTVVLIILDYAPAGREGSVSGSLRVVEALAVAVGAGLGGAGVALARNLHWASQIGIAIAFGLALAGCLTGLVTAWRLAGRRGDEATAGMIAGPASV